MKAMKDLYSVCADRAAKFIKENAGSAKSLDEIFDSVESLHDFLHNTAKSKLRDEMRHNKNGKPYLVTRTGVCLWISDKCARLGFADYGYVRRHADELSVGGKQLKDDQGNPVMDKNGNPLVFFSLFMQQGDDWTI